MTPCSKLAASEKANTAHVEQVAQRDREIAQLKAFAAILIDASTECSRLSQKSDDAVQELAVLQADRGMTAALLQF